MNSVLKELSIAFLRGIGYNNRNVCVRKDIAVAAFTEKHRKAIFYCILILSFITIFAYNFLTPYLSDDYAYLIEVKKATSLWDLLKQQYGEYLSNSGRFVGQFNVRLSLSVDKQIFNVVNSGMFTALLLLMYHNIRRKKKYDIFVLLLLLVFLWKYAVSFGQTMLWICGACNYLWGSVYILGFLTFYRYHSEHAEEGKHPLLLAAGAFFFGVLAGWCNENTSGGGLLLVLLFGLNYFLDCEKKRLHPFMVSGILGMCCGIFGMISAPGVRNRSQTMSEGDYTGLVGLVSRFYKTTMTVRDLFWVLLVMAVLVLVLLVLQKKLTCFRDVRRNESVLFLLAAAATAYALVLAPVPTDRAFFGAGIFLMIAVIQGIQDTMKYEMTWKAAKYVLISVLCLWLFFTYIENLVNLARIYREEQERTELILAEKADPDGDGIVVIPQYRKAFENPFSCAHESDLTEDKEYWINHFYEIYYDVGNITAIPRDEWNERYGQE